MPEERSLADDAAPVDPTPTPGAATSPLGTPNPTTTALPEPPAVSIVDTILDLDELLSADVRRAEKTARFCAKPWLEGDIDERVFQLDSLTDETGRPLDGCEDEAYAKAVEIQTLQAEYAAAFVSVRMGQLPSDDWKAFRAKWRADLDKGAPFPNGFYDDLIVTSALRPTISPEMVKKLRRQLGDPQMDVLANAAWVVNTESGVSVPKSPLSSAVLRRAARALS